MEAITSLFVLIISSLLIICSADGVTSAVAGQLGKCNIYHFLSQVTLKHITYR